MDIYERSLQQLVSKVHCGVGNIIIPSDVDREEYITTCFATETVSILPELGGMSYNNVPIDIDALQHIEFPVEGNTYGSQVVYLLHPKTRFPIIVAVLSKKSELFGVQNKQFKFFKEDGGNYVSVVGDGHRGNLYVAVSGNENMSGGQISIQILNPSEKALLSLSVQGDIQLIHSNLSVSNLTTKIVSRDNLEVSTKEVKLEAEDKVEVSTKEVKLDASEKVSLGANNYEPAVLGNQLKGILGDLIDAICALTVTCSTPTKPSSVPNNTIQFTVIKAKLQKILSQKVETE